MDEADIRADGEGEEEEVDPGQDEEQKYPNMDEKTRDRVKELFTMFDKDQH